MLKLIYKAKFVGFFSVYFCFLPGKKWELKKRKKKKVWTFDREKWSEGKKECAYLWQNLLIFCSNENLEVNGEGTLLERTNKKKQQQKTWLDNLVTLPKEQESRGLIYSCLQAKLNSLVTYYLLSFGWNWRTETYWISVLQSKRLEKREASNKSCFYKW